MFKLFKNKKDIEDNITFDEREKLLTIYLREAKELCSSFSYNFKSYRLGGNHDLDKLIEQLKILQERIKNIETKETINRQIKIGG